MLKSLSDGKVVELGKLGSLRVSISSSGEENSEDVNASNIKISRVLFRPGNDITNLLKTLEFEKIDS
jgi:predicted histone-like DNA-binding protein